MTQLLAIIGTPFLIFVSVVNAVFAILIYIKDRTRSTRFFIVSVLGAALWSASVGLFVVPGLAEPFSLFFAKTNYIAGAIIATSFLLFALTFGSPKKFKFPTHALVILPGIGAALLVAAGGVVVDVFESDFIKGEVFGVGYVFYVAYLVGYFVAALGILFQKYQKSDGVFKKQLQYIFFGTSVAVTVGLFANIVLPSLFGIFNFLILGPVGTLGMVVLISYAITKHGLWDFRLIAIELFVSAIVLTLFVETLLAQNAVEVALMGGVFAAVVILGVILIKNLHRGAITKDRLRILSQNLRAANDRLRELDIEKSDFVSIASHQLRTPLSVIRGYASMLLEGAYGTAANQKQHAAIDRVFHASQNLVMMIEDFLDIARLEKREMAYVFEHVDVGDVVAAIGSELATTLAREDISLSVDKKSDDELSVIGDRTKIRQVVANVLDNAIRYTPKGGKIDITLFRNKDRGVVTLVVKDTGIGISKAMMPKLFEKFSRAKGMSKLHTEGRGLALYVAKQIIVAMGGKIWAESGGKNTGSTFHIELPDAHYQDSRKEVPQIAHVL